MFKDLVFEKAPAEKDENNLKKRPVIARRRDFCARPHFVRNDPGSDKLRKLFGHKQHIRDLIKSNGFKPNYFYQTSK